MTRRIKTGAAVATLLTLAMAVGQSSPPKEATAATGEFAPLRQWKAAILARDASALEAFYSTQPLSKVKASGGEFGPRNDIDFWTGLHAEEINLEIFRDNTSIPGTRVILFQAEVKAKSDSGTRLRYVKVGQEWQLHGMQWRIVETERGDPFYLKQVFRTSGKLYSEDADAKADIAAGLAKAAREHKRVLLMFGANWCYDCYVLDLAFQRPDFAPVVATYEVVHVDLGPDGKKNADLVEKYGVPLERGVPAFAVLGSDGALLVSQKQGEMKNARAATPEAVLEFLNRWKPKQSE